MQAYQIFFIDDELNSSIESQTTGRATLVDSLSKDHRFEILPFHPVDFQDQSSEGKIEITPDLIIIDYKLGGGSNTNQKRYHGTGYLMTSYCKEKYPDVPCYLISQLIDEDISVSEHYDKKISHGFLTKPIGRDTLASDCSAYRLLKEEIKHIQNEELIVKLLKIPDGDRDSFKVAVPSEFLNELKLKEKETQSVADSESVLIKFTKWINTIFLTRRGPLINAMELATLLGINVDFFENGSLDGRPIKNYFSEAKYIGIFGDGPSERWWTQQCFNQITILLDGIGSAEPWKLLPQVLNIPEMNKSRCAVCDKPYPEIVAIDRYNGKNHPCHWACTAAGDLSDDIVGFEPQFYLNV